MAGGPGCQTRDCVLYSPGGKVTEWRREVSCVTSGLCLAGGEGHSHTALGSCSRRPSPLGVLLEITPAHTKPRNKLEPQPREPNTGPPGPKVHPSVSVSVWWWRSTPASSPSVSTGSSLYFRRESIGNEHFKTNSPDL